jgi:hypothetical protein
MAVIHRSAWKGNSQKFAYVQFGPEGQKWDAMVKLTGIEIRP